MYQIENWKQVGRLRTELAVAPSRRLWVSGNVVFLGLTSLFTDISSEMVSTVLPMYLVLFLQLTPLQFGVLDGLYQGAAALVRVVAGLAADKWRRHKEVAIAGYGLSAACKLGLLVVGGAWTGLASVILLDRTGKGIRTAPRDALISLSEPRERLATAFGVHRALDTTGAMLGPLIAFGLLTLTPGGFDNVFVVSLCAAIIGVGILTLFVQNRSVSLPQEGAGLTTVRDALALLRASRFRTLIIVGAALGLVTMSDGFLYLGLQRRMNFNAGLFPLLYVATALVYLLLAVPIGQLADRFGRARVFVGGHALLLIVYSSLLLPTVGYLELVVYLLLYGAFYAATDGVLMALASAELPPSVRTSGLALLTTATSLARLLASVLFGAVWTWWGVETSVMLFAAGLLAAILAAAFVLTRSGTGALDEAAA
jgi:MFS family permease